MSLTKKIAKASPNPAEWYVTVKAGQKQGWFERYIKPEKDGDKGENVQVDFTKKGFYVLDNNLQSCGGYNDTKGSEYSIIANEVRTLNEDGTPANGTIAVYGYPIAKGSQKFHIATGTWKEIKDEVDKRGGGYLRCIYAMNEHGQLIHIKLHGAAYASFLTEIEDRKKNTEDENKVPRIHRQWIRVKEEWELKSKGQTDYKVPVFEWGDVISDEEYAKAVELDTKLQEYLEGYLKRGATSEAATNSGAAADTPAAEGFDIKKWRLYREHDDQKYLGELSMDEIYRLKETKEQTGRETGTLYDCLGQAAYEYEQIKKKETWKTYADREGRKLEDYKIIEIKEKLELINKHEKLGARTHESKLYLYAALEVKQAAPMTKEEKEAYTPKGEGDENPF